MSDTAYKMLAKEAKVLEYWRKKYLGQAAMVLIAAAGAVAAAWFYVEAALLKLLFGLCAVLVAYLMLKELRESLQTRGEMLIFAKGKDLFADAAFDYGQGLDKGDKLWGAWEYNVRECRGVLSGEGYLLEEDWLYNTAAAKFFTLKMTVFEGVLLAAVCPAGKENALADRQEIRAAGEKMRRMLAAMRQADESYSGGDISRSGLSDLKANKKLALSFLRPSATFSLPRSMPSFMLSLSFSKDMTTRFSLAKARIFTERLSECARSTANTPKNSPTKKAKPRWDTNQPTQPVMNLWINRIYTAAHAVQMSENSGQITPCMLPGRAE